MGINLCNIKKFVMKFTNFKLYETGTSYFGPNVFSAKLVGRADEELRVYR